MASVLVVEDDPAFRTRFSGFVQAAPDLRLAGAAATLAEARIALAREVPDVLVTDLGLPDGNGIDLIRQTAARHPSTDIMVISVFGDEGHVVRSIEAGATGYILKDSVADEFVNLVRQLRAGGSPISPMIARHVLKRLRMPASVSDPADAGLTAREAEVLTLVAKGFSFAEIARLLSVSPHTITAHVKKIYEKLAVHSRGEAVYEAGRMGLL